MSSSKSNKTLWIIVVGAGLCLLAVVCVVGLAASGMFSSESETAMQADTPAPSMEIVEPTSMEEIVAPTSAPVEIQPTSPLEAPTLRSGLYRHPSGTFEILPYSDQYDEGDNYVTFYDDSNTVDVTVFSLNGDLRRQNAPTLADEVLDMVLVQTGWAESYTLDIEVQAIADGFMFFFSIPTNARGENSGSLYLRQVGPALHAITLLTADYGLIEDTWLETVSSYIAGRPPAASGPPAEGAADSGFRPEVNGFSFENYTNEVEPVNLTPESMRRMFGDEVCASTAGGACTLTPPARQWMMETNAAMDGGHCEGMAVLSQLFYYGINDPNQFGNDNAYELPFSAELQQEIAYWFVTQSTFPGGYTKINESPLEVVNALIDTFAQGQSAKDSWVVGIYKRDGSDGHAVTPFAVEDMGSGRYDILIYDNNFPGETRRIEVDANDNTWSYYTATNPGIAEALYEGDASTRTLEVVSIAPRLTRQECHFCEGRTAAPGGPRGLASQQYYEIYLDGNTDLLIEDEQGRQIGYLDGKLVNNIPGARVDTYRFGKPIWELDYEPIYRIPIGLDFTIAVLGANLTEPSTATITVLGPGYFLEISDIWLEPGEVDAVGFAEDNGFLGLVYLSNYAESPAVIMGLERAGADYLFVAQATELTGQEDTLNMGIDFENGQFVLNSSENAQAGTYDIYVLRINEDGEISAFGATEVVLQPFSTLYLQYLNWSANGLPMPAGLDTNDDGVIDEVLELADTSDAFNY